jgi:hypothetical protein
VYQPNGPAVINQKQQEEEEKKINDRIKKATDEAIAKYKQEASRPNQLAQAIQHDKEEEKKQAPLRPPDINVIRPNQPEIDFSFLPPAEEIILDKEEFKQDHSNKIKKVEKEIDELTEQKMAKDRELEGKKIERRQYKSGTKEYNSYNKPLGQLKKEIENLHFKIERLDESLRKLHGKV